jgi:pantoate--beta-alanine ligase
MSSAAAGRRSRLPMGTSTPTHPRNDAAVSVVRSVDEVRQWVSHQRRVGTRVAMVPTMGSLHEGHLSLVRRAAQDDHAVLMSIFVNPTQFAPTEDFGAYPRDEAADLGAAGAAGVACVFAPSADEIYPEGFATAIEVSGPARGLEGAARPTHFSGVATVVAKLLIAARPDRAVFGAKDAQQVAVIRRLVRDLHLDDIELVEGPTVREPDGLAMSSRNRYLAVDERRAARALSAGLFAASEAATTGRSAADELIGIARAPMDAEPLVDVEYVALVDAGSFTPLDRLTLAPARLCVAARVGPARLIDNVPLGGENP